MYKSRAKELLGKIEDLNRRLEILERTVLEAPDFSKPPLKKAQFLDLPDSLRTTMGAMQSLGEANAQDVGQKTGRTRTVENIYLNQLTRLGYLTKARRGRKIYFKLAKYY